MKNLWLKIRVWSKIGIFALLLLYLVMFMVQNANKTVTVWVWFSHEPETTVLKLISSMLAAGVVGTLLVRTGWRTIRQIRDLRDRNRAMQLEKDVASMREKAGRLQTRPSAMETMPPPE